MVAQVGSHLIRPGPKRASGGKRIYRKRAGPRPSRFEQLQEHQRQHRHGAGYDKILHKPPFLFGLRQSKVGRPSPQVKPTETLRRLAGIHLGQSNKRPLVTLRRQHNTYRLNDKLQVSQHAALLDVQKIKTDPFIEADVIAVPAGLPEASDARFYQKALSLIGGVLAHLTRKGGTWTDDRHVAFQNIDELW